MRFKVKLVTHNSTSWAATIPAGQDFVDVKIVARDDNVVDDNERVHLNITNAYATVGKPFQFKTYTPDDVWTHGTGANAETVYPGGFVLIKEEGWAVQSIFWEKHATGNPLTNTWTGKSVYADKDTPTSNNAFNTVDIVVTVEGLLPVGGGTVALTALDPPNASGTGAANNDGALGLAQNPLTFTNNAKTKTTTATVGLFAGDNYIVKATPNNGQQGNFALSETLTVWRRLWAELDQMAEPEIGYEDGF